MENVFVDTGIIIAVVLGEPTRERILDETRNTTVISASSLPYEVGNALTRNVL